MPRYMTDSSLASITFSESAGECHYHKLSIQRICFRAETVQLKLHSKT